MTDPWAVGDGVAEYGERVGSALAYAARMHAGQTRKGKTEPYLSHVLQVAALALRYGGTEDEVIAAALHDVPEDCGGRARLDEIRAAYGDEVARMVEDCTDSLTDSREAKLPWSDRKIAHLEHARHLSADSALVAACDKIANLTDLVRDYQAHGDATLTRFRGGPTGTRAYYAAMHATLAGRLDAGPVADLAALLQRLDAPEVPTGRDPVEWFSDVTLPAALAAASRS